MLGRNNKNDVTQEAVMAALSKVQEPELHNDLVSLNMIRDLTISGGDVGFTIVLTPPACPLRGALGLAATCSGAAASVCSACSARVFGSCGDFVFWGSLFCFCVPVLRCAVLLLLAWGLAILPCPVPGAVLPCVRCPPLALGFGCCAGSIAVCVTFSSSIAFSTNICDLSLL